MKKRTCLVSFLIIMLVFLLACCNKGGTEPFGNTTTKTTEAETTEGTTAQPVETAPYTTAVTTTEQRKTETVYATARVNVRKEPNTDCEIVGSLSVGESVERTKILSNGWSKVIYCNEECYISSSYLSSVKPSPSGQEFVDPLADGRIIVDPAAGNPYLVVVNAKRAMTPSYKPVLSEIFDTGYYMEQGVTPYYEKMYTAAKKDGITLTPYSAYRSYERQKNNYINLTKTYMSQYNLNETEAAKKAATVILPPGTSEHNLGLAMDICNTKNSFADTKEYKWLTENAHKYGFILRYTAEKQSITGIVPEPWHWRFVGVEYAEDIKNSGLCLEEYLDSKGIAY